MKPAPALAAVFVLALLTVASPASAAPTTIGSFPTWVMVRTTDAGLTFTGRADFSAAAQFPGVTVETNSTTVKTPTGESAWLGDSTGFGQHFGSTRAQPYLYLSPATGGPSTTTLEFDAAPPAGWGLAVGDIDADFVQIIPRDAAGDPLPGSVLGAQDTGGIPLLNYCNNVPKPSSCVGPGPFTDAPFWFENGTTITTPAGTTTYTTPIVNGNLLDTSGAYDWFLPSTDVRSLDLVFTTKSGFPTYQVWLAAPAPVATITATVVTADGDPAPEGTTVLLEEPDGDPVLGLDNTPVEIPVEPDGSFEIVTEQAEYRLEFDVPDGFDPIPPIDVDATSATVELGEITIEPAAEAPGPADPADPADPDDPDGPNVVDPDQLPATGTEIATPLALGGALLLAGAALLVARRRRTH